MTKTLEKALDAVAKLPAKQQDRVADFLMEEVTRMQMLAKIERAERDLKVGRVVTQAQARERMKKWLS